MKNCCQPRASPGNARRSSKSAKRLATRPGSSGSPKPGRTQKPASSQNMRSWSAERRRALASGSSASNRERLRLGRPLRPLAQSLLELAQQILRLATARVRAGLAEGAVEHVARGLEAARGANGDLGRAHGARGRGLPLAQRKGQPEATRRRAIGRRAVPGVPACYLHAGFDARQVQRADRGELRPRWRRALRLPRAVPGVSACHLHADRSRRAR